MRKIISISLVLVLILSPPHALGDGCFLGKNGIYIREEAQHAFIEWEDGIERLHLTVKAEKHEGPSVWIVPVPANPEDVQVEPCGTLPLVYATSDVIEGASVQIAGLTVAWFGLNTGLLPLAAFSRLLPESGCSAERQADELSLVDPSDVVVHNRIAKLGPIIEVLTAKSGEGLDQYLTNKGIQTESQSIEALEPYMNKEFTLVCGWPADEERPLEARSVQIEFPSENIFYPLLPTRVYESEVRTSVFVKGWVQPVEGLDIAGLGCRYLQGGTFDLKVDELLGRDEWDGPREVARRFKQRVDSSETFPITEVRISQMPSEWDQDLYLTPDVPDHVRYVTWIIDYWRYLVFACPAILGGLMGFILPFLLIPENERSYRDFIWGPMCGAALCFSVVFSSFMCLCWVHRPRKGSLNEFGPVNTGILICVYLSILCLVLMSFLVLLLGGELGIPIESEAAITLGFAGTIVAMLMTLLNTGLLKIAIQIRATGYIVFVALHFGVLFGLGRLADSYIQPG